MSLKQELQNENNRGMLQDPLELVVGHSVEELVAGVLDDLVDGDHLTLDSVQEAGPELVAPVHMHAEVTGACLLSKMPFEEYACLRVSFIKLNSIACASKR